VNALLPHPATRAVNHVLRSTPLAMERLAKHAGRTIAVHVGPATWVFTLQTTGEVTPAVTGASRDLEMRISPFVLPRLAAGEAAAAAGISMQGDAALAEEIGFIARHLTWDVEEDLARVVGDVAAHRIVGGARAFAAWGRDAAFRTGAAAAEYWTEESPLIASRVKVEDFTRGVAELDRALAALEARLERLSRPPA
jgi:ubiquinone biosynthesis accessory factor UbiJ